MNKAAARSSRRKNVLSFEPEHARQPTGGSDLHTLILVGPSVNQRLLERVEAENAQLRGSVVELMLQIQALRDGARTERVVGERRGWMGRERRARQVWRLDLATLRDMPGT
jgi:hypothetical protein